MNLRRIDPGRDTESLREFLLASDPEDYLLEQLDEWIHDGRLWAGTEGGRWVAAGRLNDLGEREGWVSAMRVAAPLRGRGLGRELLEGILSDAQALGIVDVRAVIENENTASRRLFERLGFRPAFEMTLRRGLAASGPSGALRPAAPDSRPLMKLGWLPAVTGRVDLVVESAGGRFGRWRPSLIDRWIRERKLYVAPGLAVVIQPDWWRDPRTLWVNPLEGAPEVLVPELAALTQSLGHAEWQAFFPSTEELRADFDRLGLVRHPAWGDRVQLYERSAQPLGPA